MDGNFCNEGNCEESNNSDPLPAGLVSSDCHIRATRPIKVKF